MIHDVHSFSKLKGVPLLWRSKGVLPLLLYSRDYRRKDITLVCVSLAAGGASTLRERVLFIVSIAALTYFIKGVQLKRVPLGHLGARG